MGNVKEVFSCLHTREQHSTRIKIDSPPHDPSRQCADGAERRSAKGAKASTCARGRNELSTRLQRKIRAERASLGWWHVGRRERAAGGGEGQLPGADLYGFEVLHRHLLGGRGARISAMTAGCRPKCSGIRAG